MQLRNINMMSFLLSIIFVFLSVSPSQAEYNIAGDWTFKKLVIPATGIQSGEAIKKAEEMIGKTIKIDGQNFIYEENKNCIFDDIHQEILIDGSFDASGKMMVNWNEIGIEPYSQNSRGNKLYAVISYGGYCPDSSDLTEEEKVRIDWTMVDEYEGYKFLDDKHVIFVANKGQLVLMDYFDVWIQLERSTTANGENTQDIVDPEKTDN